MHVQRQALQLVAWLQLSPAVTDPVIMKTEVSAGFDHCQYM